MNTATLEAPMPALYQGLSLVSLAELPIRLISCNPERPGNEKIVLVACRDYLWNRDYRPETVESAYNALAYIYGAFSHNLSPLYPQQTVEGITANPNGPVYNPVIYLENNIGKAGFPPRVDLVAPSGFDYAGIRNKLLNFLRNKYRAKGLHHFSLPDVANLENIFATNQVVCTDDLSVFFRRFTCITPENDDVKVSRIFRSSGRMDGELILTWNEEGEPPFLAIDFAVPVSIEDSRLQGMVSRKSLFNITIHSPDHRDEGQVSQQLIEVAGDSDVSCLQLLVPLSRIALTQGHYPFSSVCNTSGSTNRRPMIIAAPDGNSGTALTDNHAEMLVLRGYEDLVRNASFFAATDPCPACALNIRQVNPENYLSLLRQTRRWSGIPILSTRHLNEDTGLPLIVSRAVEYTDLKDQMLAIFEEANRTIFRNQFDRLIKINSI